jgi:poly(3-hydroxybutyrate) depolymerase
MPSPTEKPSDMRLLILLSVLLCSCNQHIDSATQAYRQTKSVSYNSVSVDVIIDKPAKNDLDVLLVFHGTVMYDREILIAANNTLDKFKAILDSKDMMIVSVAYSQENVLLGDR